MNPHRYATGAAALFLAAAFSAPLASAQSLEDFLSHTTLHVGPFAEIGLDDLPSMGSSSLGSSAATAIGGFDITLAGLAGLTPSQQAAFTFAASVWESVILDYRPATAALLNAFGIFGPTITLAAMPIDGAGGTLGSTGLSAIFSPAVIPDPFIYAAAGSITLDTADAAALEAAGLLEEVAFHEIGHALGFGTLWVANGVYVTGSGQFTGLAATATFAAEFGEPSLGFVPVELGGGPGTANSHWDETFAFQTLIGGLPLDNEILTGFLDPTNFLSATTVASFFDIGYIVIPAPAPSLALLAAGLGLTPRRRRTA